MTWYLIRCMFRWRICCVTYLLFNFSLSLSIHVHLSCVCVLCLIHIFCCTLMSQFECKIELFKLIMKLRITSRKVVSWFNVVFMYTFRVVPGSTISIPAVAGPGLI